MRPSTHRLGNDRGFALPFTLFLVTLITLMLAFAFSRTAVETEVSGSSEAQVNAQAVAQAGLSAFFSDSFTMRPVSGDSIRYNVTGGYAWVYTEELQRPADTVNNPVVYTIRSHGYVIHPNQGATPQAERTLMQFARWHSAQALPSTPALLTAGNGVINPDTTGQFTLLGNNANTCSDPSPPPNLSQIYATPALPYADAENGTGRLQNADSMVIHAATGINWAQITSGGFTADANTILANDTTYQTQMVTGNATIAMPDNGTGLLIVTGNLRITGGMGSGSDVDWDGIILVGGYITSTATYFDLNGILITGLNELLGMDVPPDTLGGTGLDADLVYDACKVQRAMRRLSGFIPVNLAWVDNWATY